MTSPCIRFISNSLVTPDALSHDDLKKFAGVPNDNNQKQKTKIPRKCQGCKEDDWKQGLQILLMSGVSVTSASQMLEIFGVPARAPGMYTLS